MAHEGNLPANQLWLAKTYLLGYRGFADLAWIYLRERATDSVFTDTTDGKCAAPLLVKILAQQCQGLPDEEKLRYLIHEAKKALKTMKKEGGDTKCMLCQLCSIDKGIALEKLPFAEDTDITAYSAKEIDDAQGILKEFEQEYYEHFIFDAKFLDRIGRTEVGRSLLAEGIGVDVSGLETNCIDIEFKKYCYIQYRGEVTKERTSGAVLACTLAEAMKPGPHRFAPSGCMDKGLN